MAISSRGEGGVGGARGGSSSYGYGAESKASKLNRKAGEVIRKGQAETIAKNSVKVVKPQGKLANASTNIKAKERAQDIASGSRAKRESANVKQTKPAKVVKINSAPAKSADAAKKAADAKALKAANKKRK